MQVTSSAPLPANARNRRTRHATSAPVAPEYVCASSSTMNDSGAPVNSSKSCWRVISSSSWFAFVIRIRGLRSRISCSLAHSSNGTTSRSFALRLRLAANRASRPSPSSRCVDVAVRRPARGRPDVHPVRDPCARKQQPQAVALIGRQRVHRVDEYRDDAVGLVRVAHPQAAVDDRVQEGLGLAGAGSGRDEHVPTRQEPPAASRPDGRTATGTRPRPAARGARRPRRLGPRASRLRGTRERATRTGPSSAASP